MAWFGKGRRADLLNLCKEIGVEANEDMIIFKIKNLIVKSEGFEEDFAKEIFEGIIAERLRREEAEAEQKKLELDREDKERQRVFELEKLKIEVQGKRDPNSSTDSISEVLINSSVDLGCDVQSFDLKESVAKKLNLGYTPIRKDLYFGNISNPVTQIVGECVVDIKIDDVFVKEDPESKPGTGESGSESESPKASSDSSSKESGTNRKSKKSKLPSKSDLPAGGSSDTEEHLSETTDSGRFSEKGKEIRYRKVKMKDHTTTAHVSQLKPLRDDDDDDDEDGNDDDEEDDSDMD